MHFPTWIDLKGQDSVPDTVHHVVILSSPLIHFNSSRVDASDSARWFAMNVDIYLTIEKRPSMEPDLS